MEFFAIVSVLFGLFVTIFWLVIGWRAMKAHERIGDAAAEWMHLQRAEREAKRRAERPDAPIYPRYGTKRGEGDS